MTLGEKIAARKAAELAAKPIDGTGTPGKPLTPRASRGVVISNKQDPAPVPTVDPDYHEDRTLSVPQGQAVDMTPVDALLATKTWHQALNSFVSELVITNDPENPEQAWIAIQPSNLVAPLILLHRLQYVEHPQTKRPENHPF